MQLWVGEHNGVSFPLFLEKKDLWQHSLHVLFPVLLSLVCFCLYVGTLLLSVFTSRTADEQWELKNYEKFRRNKVKIVWKTHNLELRAGHGAALAHIQTHSQRLFSAVCLFSLPYSFFSSSCSFPSFFLIIAENVAFCCDIFLHTSCNKTNRLIMQALNSFWDVNNCHLLWLIFKNEQVLTFHGIL